MLNALTEQDYLAAHDSMEAFSVKNDNCLDYWLQWWDKRRTHIFKAFKPIDAPNVNMAEIGHAAMANTCPKDMLLIKACRVDVMFFIRQKADIESFENGSGSCGRGPLVHKTKTLLYKKQMECARAYSKDIIGIDLNETRFVPKTGIHRPRNNKRQATNVKMKRVQKRRKISNNHEVGENDNPDMNYTQPYHNNCKFVLFLASGRENKCAGCGIALPTKPPRPFDLIVKHRERYGYPNGSGLFVYTKAKMRDVVYHANDHCIKNRHPYFSTNRLVIEADVATSLAPVHIKLIKDHFAVDVEQLSIFT